MNVRKYQGLIPISDLLVKAFADLCPQSALEDAKIFKLWPLVLLASGCENFVEHSIPIKINKARDLIIKVNSAVVASEMILHEAHWEKLVNNEIIKQKIKAKLIKKIAFVLNN